MSKKPNVVIIYIDDMGFKDIACAGSEFYETPNVDKLRENGMMFTNGYASCPVCSPSRASLLTGKYPARVGVTDWIDGGGETHPCKGILIDAPYIKHLPKSEKTIAHYLKEVGYNTWHVGKWHLGTQEFYPEKFGFDKNVAGCEWGCPSKGYFSPYYIPNLSEGPEGEFLTDRITNEAIKIIEESDEKPFFLNFWHYAVHTPIQAPQKDIDYFTEKAQRLGLDKINPLVIGENFPTEHKKHLNVQRRIIQSDPTYAGLIYNLDENIGRLVGALEKKGVLDNTLIIFSADNGGLSTAEGSPTCNLPVAEGKGWTKDGGVRVPMVCYWKDQIKPNTTCEIPMTTPDIFATIAEVCGANVDDPNIDGVSLMPIFKNEKFEERPIFWHYPHYGNQGGTPGSAVRLGDYKLIEYFEDGHFELYNLKEDVGEKTDISGIETEKFAELKTLLKNWQVDVTAIFPKQNF